MSEFEFGDIVETHTGKRGVVVISQIVHGDCPGLEDGVHIDVAFPGKWSGDSSLGCHFKPEDLRLVSRHTKP